MTEPVRSPLPMFLFISVTQGGNVNEALAFLWQEQSPRKELKNDTFDVSEPP